MNRSLFELQEADIHVARIVRETARLDNGGAARAEKDALQAKVDAAGKHLHEATASRTDKELEQKSVEDKIARQQSRLMNAKNAHEVTSLQRDIAALSHTRGDLDETILTLMDEVETAAAQLAALEEQLAEAKRQVIGVEHQYKVDKARLDAELAEATVKRGEVASTIDADSLEKYGDYAKLHQGLAVVHSEKGNCSGCGMALTPYNLREAKSQEWPTCENCGRLLFVA